MPLWAGLRGHCSIGHMLNRSTFVFYKGDMPLWAGLREYCNIEHMLNRCPYGRGLGNIAVFHLLNRCPFVLYKKYLLFWMMHFYGRGFNKGQCLMEDRIRGALQCLMGWVGLMGLNGGF